VKRAAAQIIHHQRKASFTNIEMTVENMSSGQNSIVAKFFNESGAYKAVSLTPTTSASEVMQTLAEKWNVADVEKYAIFAAFANGEFEGTKTSFDFKKHLNL
jgi:hypothetical protein